MKKKHVRKDFFGKKTLEVFKTFHEHLYAAEERVRAMDEIDRKAGRPTPKDLGPQEMINTAVCAFAGGLMSHDLAPFMDGIVFLKWALESHGYSFPVGMQKWPEKS